MSSAWPVELRFSSTQRALSILFEPNETVVLPYTFLRANSPSAAVRGHGSGPKPPQAPIADNITVTGAEPVGRYAVRIFFSDGHSSGLYTWAYLHKLSASAP